MDKSEVQMYLSAQQITQFEAMNPNALEIAFRSAMGLLTAELHDLYDLQAAITVPFKDRNPTLVWLLAILTAVHVAGPSMALSKLLYEQYQMAVNKITELKNHIGVLVGVPTPCPNAYPSGVSIDYEFRG